MITAIEAAHILRSPKIGEETLLDNVIKYAELCIRINARLNKYEVTIAPIPNRVVNAVCDSLISWGFHPITIAHGGWYEILVHIYSIECFTEEAINADAHRRAVIASGGKTNP